MGRLIGARKGPGVRSGRAPACVLGAARARYFLWATPASGGPGQNVEGPRCSRLRSRACARPSPVPALGVVRAKPLETRRSHSEKSTLRGTRPRPHGEHGAQPVDRGRRQRDLQPREGALEFGERDGLLFRVDREVGTRISRPGRGAARLPGVGCSRSCGISENSAVSPDWVRLYSRGPRDALGDIGSCGDALQPMPGFSLGGGGSKAESRVVAFSTSRRLCLSRQ